MPEKQPSDHDLLVRIDEQTKSIKDDLAELKNTVYGENGLKERVQRIENTSKSAWSTVNVIAIVAAWVVTTSFSIAAYFKH